MSIVLLDSLRAWWPEAILSAGALAVLLLGVLLRDRRGALIGAWITLAASAAALLVSPVPPATSLFSGLIV